MTPSAIIFDCDGVLVNSEELVIDVERRFLAEIGLVYDDVEFLTRFVGTSDADFLAALRAEVNTLIDRLIPGGNTTAIMKGTCAATLGSAAMLVQ